MRRFTAVIILAFMAVAAGAQTPKDVEYSFTEASDLNLIGKIIENTPNPYHRVDTVKYKGFTKGENSQVRSSAGLAVLFKTNSSVISVLTDFGYMNNGLMILPPMALILLGCIIWVQRSIQKDLQEK